MGPSILAKDFVEVWAELGGKGNHNFFCRDGGYFLLLLVVRKQLVKNILLVHSGVLEQRWKEVF